MTVVSAAALALIAVLALGCVDLTQALAAAQELAVPSGADPADVARFYAESNGATLVSCERSGAQVTVEVDVRVPPLALLPGDHFVHASARAVVGP